MRYKKSIIILFILAVIAIGITAVVLYLNSRPNNTASRSTINTPEGVELKTVTENLDTPWSVVFYGNTALISSRDTGQIRELNSETGASRVIGTVPGAIHRGEGGLLGLTLDSQQRLYAYYTTATDNRVSRFELNGEPGNLSLGKSKVLIEGLPSASNHNGGRIAFGPDKLLYVTVGDAGVPRSAQDRAQLGGKILRMTSDGDVPINNPYANSFVYSYGHRNPQGLAWSEDGTMYASEFGQNTWDELNVIKAGANYGWPEVEGREGRDGFVDPVQQWATSEASPSGMTYAGGLLYIANLRGAVLRTVPVNDLATSHERYKGEYGRIRDVTTAPDGRLWFVTNNTDGRGMPADNDDRILSISQSK